MTRKIPRDLFSLWSYGLSTSSRRRPRFKSIGLRKIDISSGNLPRRRLWRIRDSPTETLSPGPYRHVFRTTDHARSLADFRASSRIVSDIDGGRNSSARARSTEHRERNEPVYYSCSTWTSIDILSQYIIVVQYEPVVVIFWTFIVIYWVFEPVFWYMEFYGHSILESILIIELSQ